MFFNETLILQCVTGLSLFYLTYNSAPLSVWLLGGGFLFIIGFIGLKGGLGVLIGFLWVIDLGVGLIILLFLSHLSIFLESSVSAYSNSRKFYQILMVSFFLFSTLLILSSRSEGRVLESFQLNFLSYLILLLDNNFSQLNLLRESFFYANVWGFYILNLLTLVSLVGMIALQESSRNGLLRVQAPLLPLHSTPHASFFIRDQNFLLQQQTLPVVRVWTKPHRNVPHR